MMDKNPVITDKDVQSKLPEYINSDIQISDYIIEVMPVLNDMEEIYKYKISISNKEAELYLSFTLPYDMKDDYTKEKYEDDLYNKIANALKKQQEMFAYNKLKNSRYAELEVGNTFEFGVFEGKPILWKVLKKNNKRIYVCSVVSLCSKSYDDDYSNNWEKSSIRNWLNNEFYNRCFSLGEKEFISVTDEDRIVLLSKDEVESLTDKKFRIDSKKIDYAHKGYWWLRTPIIEDDFEAWIVDEKGSTEYTLEVICDLGIRPAFWLEY